MCFTNPDRGCGRGRNSPRETARPGSELDGDAGSETRPRPWLEGGEQGGDDCISDEAAAGVGPGPSRPCSWKARTWREIPVGISLENGALLEGAIDLLYQDSDGSLVVVDYKTDQVQPERLGSCLDQYRSQGE